MTPYQWITLVSLWVGQLITFTVVIVRVAWSTRMLIDTRFNTMDLKMNTIIEGDVRELRLRIHDLESGQSEWLKTLRQRTHDMAGEIQALQLKTSLLERTRHDTDPRG